MHPNRAAIRESFGNLGRSVCGGTTARGEEQTIAKQIQEVGGRKLGGNKTFLPPINANEAGPRARVLNELRICLNRGYKPYSPAAELEGGYKHSNAFIKAQTKEILQACERLTSKKVNQAHNYAQEVDQIIENLQKELPTSSSVSNIISTRIKEEFKLQASKYKEADANDIASEAIKAELHPQRCRPLRATALDRVEQDIKYLRADPNDLNLVEEQPIKWTRETETETETPSSQPGRKVAKAQPERGGRILEEVFADGINTLLSEMDSVKEQAWLACDAL
jgi:hypothetical protein